MSVIDRCVSRRAIVALVLAAVATPALAAPITTPPGLNVGEQYRLAFVGGSITAQSASIADYNALATSMANSQAELAALGTTWTAIVSTLTMDARDNTGTNPNSATGVPIFRTDGLKIADNNADLWDGTILNPLNTNQLGIVVSLVPWTGSAANGTKSVSQTAKPMGGDPAAAGFSGMTNGQWVFGGGYNNFTPNPIYALSDVLTVAPAADPATPAPTISFWGLITLSALLSALGMAIVRRRPSLTA